MQKNNENKSSEVNKYDYSTPPFLSLFSKMCVEKANSEFDSFGRWWILETQKTYNIRRITTLMSNNLFVDRIVFSYQKDDKTKEIVSPSEINYDNIDDIIKSFVMQPKENKKEISTTELDQLGELKEKLLQQYMSERKTKAESIMLAHIQKLTEEKQRVESFYSENLQSESLVEFLEMIGKKLNSKEYDEYDKFLLKHIEIFSAECKNHFIRPEIRVEALCLFKQKFNIAMEQYKDGASKSIQTILNNFLQGAEKKLYTLMVNFSDEKQKNASAYTIEQCNEELLTIEKLKASLTRIETAFREKLRLLGGNVTSSIVRFEVIEKLNLFLNQCIAAKKEIQRKFISFSDATKELSDRFYEEKLVSLKTEEEINNKFIAYEEKYSNLQKLYSDNLSLLHNDQKSMVEYTKNIESLTSGWSEFKNKRNIIINEIKKNKINEILMKSEFRNVFSILDSDVFKCGKRIHEITVENTEEKINQEKYTVAILTESYRLLLEEYQCLKQRCQKISSNSLLIETQFNHEENNLDAIKKQIEKLNFLIDEKMRERKDYLQRIQQEEEKEQLLQKALREQLEIPTEPFARIVKNQPNTFKKNPKKTEASPDRALEQKKVALLSTTSPSPKKTHLLPIVKDTIPKKPSYKIPFAVIFFGALIIIASITFACIPLMGLPIALLIGVVGAWLCLEGYTYARDIRRSYTKQLDDYYFRHSELKPVQQCLKGHKQVHEARFTLNNTQIRVGFSEKMSGEWGGFFDNVTDDFSDSSYRFVFQDESQAREWYSTVSNMLKEPAKYQITKNQDQLIIKNLQRNGVFIKCTKSSCEVVDQSIPPLTKTNVFITLAKAKDHLDHVCCTSKRITPRVYARM